MAFRTRHSVLTPGLLTLLLITTTVSAVECDTGEWECERFGNFQCQFLQYVANIWGDDFATGGTCVKATTSPPTFDIRWHWPESPDNVESFPHVKFLNRRLPTLANDLTKFEIQAEWGMALGNFSEQVDTLEDGIADTTRCNVGFDMFLDEDMDAAQDNNEAAKEMMVWLGRFDAPWPLGRENVNSRPVNDGEPVQLGGVDYELWIGDNPGRPTDNPLTVMSWLPVDESVQLTSFSGSLMPAFEYLLQIGALTDRDYVGIVELGTETFITTQPQNITLSARNYYLDLETNNPANEGPGRTGPDDFGEGEGATPLDSSSDDSEATGLHASQGLVTLLGCLYAALAMLMG